MSTRATRSISSAVSIVSTSQVALLLCAPFDASSDRVEYLTTLFCSAPRCSAILHVPFDCCCSPDAYTATYSGIYCLSPLSTSVATADGISTDCFGDTWRDRGGGGTAAFAAGFGGADGGVSDLPRWRGWVSLYATEGTEAAVAEERRRSAKLVGGAGRRKTEKRDCISISGSSW